MLSEEKIEPKKTGFKAFEGSGQSLRGKRKAWVAFKEYLKRDEHKSWPLPPLSSSSKNGKSTAQEETQMDMDEDHTFDPNDDGPLNLPFGQLFFGYPVVLPKHPEEDEKKVPHVFSGAGQTLRGKKVTPAGSDKEGKSGTDSELEYIEHICSILSFTTGR